MKDSFKNTFSVDGQKLSLAEVSEEMCKKWFGLTRKSISTTRNKAFVKIYISAMRTNCFFWQEKRKNWFPPAEKCFSFKINSPSFQ